MNFNQIPGAQGLYSPEFEHDSCGVGFVCDIKGRATRDIVTQALEVLRRMSHRGATGADPDTGDGAGILIQMPDEFLRPVCSEIGIELPNPGSYGAGLAFLPTEETRRATIKDIVRKVCEEEGLHVLGWRRVPVRADGIGKTAREAMPVIEMVLAAYSFKELEGQELERRLYRARKRAERRVADLEGSAKGIFYMPSFSSKTLVYKGMLKPDQVQDFFPDLCDVRLGSAIALIHSRYSTNTFPSWDLAQPFRILAHNGEINTLKGNKTWMSARESLLSCPELGDMRDLLPIIQEGGSDSAALDNALELLMMAGRDLVNAMMMLVPAAWEDNPLLSAELKDFYRYARCLTEAWDGPAALAFTDGSSIAAALDRNGLRPARYILTKDGRVLMASEMGVLDIDPADIAHSGRLEPGKVLCIDTKVGRIVDDREVKDAMAGRAPYGKWLTENMRHMDQKPAQKIPAFDDLALRAMNYNREELAMILGPMAKTAAEPVGSMGNDAPLAFISRKRQSLFHYFRQLFAQVTNPPIDSLREGCVMSLETVIGPSGNILMESSGLAARLCLEKPVLTSESFEQLKAMVSGSLAEISLLFDPWEGEAGYAKALDRVCAEAELAVRQGKGYIILSDRGISASKAALDSLVALGAVHQRLIDTSVRARAALILDSIEPRETHHFCVLFGYGADAIHPYGAYQVYAKLIEEGELVLDYRVAVGNYLDAIEHGLMKVLSKMGISTLQSYKGAQIFEAVGLGQELVKRCFNGTPSRVGGLGLQSLARKCLDSHREAYFPQAGSESARNPRLLPTGGFYKWRKGAEAHAWNPDTISLFQQAVRNNSFDKFKDYAKAMDEPESGPIQLRHLLKFKAGTPVPLDEVESAESIAKRFATGAMSYGSISGPAHETLALAMNRLGGMSNTGEGGEAISRFKPLPNGDSLCSYTKQVASGRFGVTTLYLANAKDIQIKIAQGAKPGEGGQLPGHKVSETIAKTRYTTPGVTLISPPPHHDIYSIEDLAQLILDLKNVNPDARVSVKLVSEVGVGTIAAGVAKAKAEMILISGGDGGTGASPLSSIKHAGLPWELGLSETHQTLVMNGLRSRVRLQCDGGIRSPRDAVIACLMGAEEFGYATSALIAEGCVMLRHCHLNNCSMGVATQDERCAGRFAGKPEHVVNFMLFMAKGMRELMAQLGFRSINEMVGHVELLELDRSKLSDDSLGVDFSQLLWKPESRETAYRDPAYIHPDMRQSLDRRLIELAKDAIDKGKATELSLDIANTDRSTGAHLAGEIMKRRGEAALEPGTLQVSFRGVAGQSFGAWLCKGVTFSLRGLANDYVGKGLFGGVLAIAPGEGADYEADQNILIGNVALYGAISGELYVRGRAGERFCVRNSGAIAVAEGVGDHGCEYMTGGVAVILGSAGRNFGAGMTGGLAFIYDPDRDFKSRFNDEFSDLATPGMKELATLKGVLERHAALTGSEKATKILRDFHNQAEYFHLIMPRDYRRYLISKGEF